MAVLTLEEVMGQLSADEKKLLDNTLAKHPELKAGWLRQDDYSKKLNEFTAKEKDFEKTKTRNETLEAWSDKVVPIWDGLAEKGIVDKETGEELWTSQRAELERQLDEAKKQAVGGDMDPAELDKRVKEIVKEAGVALTKTEMAALIASEGKKLAQETFDENWGQKETKFNEETIPFVAGFSAANAIAAQKYERETGKTWDADTQKEFFKLMGEKKNFDPFAAIDDFIAPTKRSKEIEDKDAEIDRLRKLVEQRQSVEGGGDQIIPQEEQLGSLQLMLKQSEAADGDVESKVRAGIIKSAQELVESRR